MDLASVRAEIKHWERAFKQKHGANPSVDDIRARPDIQDKYKLYKKLARAQHTQTEDAPRGRLVHASTSGPPSTPPRPPRRLPPAAPVPLPARVHDTAPVDGFNPFSPAKKDTRRPGANPFASPSPRKKLKLVPKGDAKLIPKDDAKLIPKDDAKSIPKDDTKLIPKDDAKFIPKNDTKLIPKDAKRDRKPGAQPIPKDAGLPKNPARDDAADADADALFPPIARPTHNHVPTPELGPGLGRAQGLGPGLGHGGAQGQDAPLVRARKRLRGEPVSPSPAKAKRARVLSFPRARSPVLPFPRGRKGGASEDEEGDEGEGEEDEDADTSFVADSPVKRAGRAFRVLFDEGEEGEGAAPRGTRGTQDWGKGQAKAPPAKSDETRTPEADAMDMDVDVDADMGVDASASPPAHEPLLPPSPPPQTTNGASKPYANAKGKGKGMAPAPAKPAKRPRMSDPNEDDKEADEGEDSGSEAAAVKMLPWARVRRRGPRDVFAPDFALDFADATPPRRLSPPPSPAAEPPSAELPSALRSLSLTFVPPPRVRSGRNVVERVLYGRRRGGYDPERGGEIWGAGEDGYAGLDDERRGRGEGDGEDGEEDEWEGEGVPWEVGEL